MSILSTKALMVVPSAANGNTLTAGTPAWTSGSWVEFIASAADDVAVAALVTSSAPSQFEVDLGVGTAGNEVVVATVAWTAGNPGNGGPGHFQLPIPHGPIAAGSRVALRMRSATASGTCEAVLQYVEDPDADTTTAPLSCAPSAASGVTVTPNGTAWNNSSWVELASGLSDPSGIVGLAYGAGVNRVDFEFDIGAGAASSEVVLTTLRSMSIVQPSGSGLRRSHVMLNAPYLAVSGTRIACRLRKAGTDTTAWNAKLLFYGNVIAGGSPARSFAQWR